MGAMGLPELSVVPPRDPAGPGRVSFSDENRCRAGEDALIWIDGSENSTPEGNRLFAQ